MIYLDHAATTKPHDDVIAAMEPYLREQYHNPSAQYASSAADGVRTARQQVADLLGTSTESIVVTGGGSEADNLALKGVFDHNTRGHLVTSTEKAGRVPRGRPKIREFRDHENLRFSNDLTPRVNAVSSIRRVQYVRYTVQSSG
ncbi:aminotransferase class V-fold PLP-dependent enzyme [Halalkaliarchaeum desulfuricum]|uniref:aminotransferase class V-fold PLP-dependent enzyme n=1 Tax=Halalkaliarchaeum desulfuricum TaxID=2055893 RepID=UPI000E6B8115